MPKYNPVTAATIDSLAKIVGPCNILTDAEKMEPYSHDEEIDPRKLKLPEVVVFPHSTEEVAEIVKLANSEIIPVVPRGAGTGLANGAVPVYGGIVISFERMNNILEINKENMYMVVEPGVRTEVVQQAAKETGLFYAGDPCSGDSCFIGGNVATNAGGNRAVKYGTTKDQVYALDVVTPQGEIVTLGARLNKKSTGYNLEQLIIGSEGTLGIVTKITLKLKPLPEYIVDLLAVFNDIDAAIAIVGKLMHAGITPTCVEFMDNTAIKSVEKYLNEKLPNSDNGNYIIIQVEGQSEDDLDDKSVAIDELCSENGAVAVLMADSQQIWQARKAFAEAVRAESLVHGKEDVVVPVEKIPETIREINRLSAKYDLPARTASHAADGNIHLNTLKGNLSDDDWDNTIHAFQQELYTFVYQIGGKLSGEHGIGAKRRDLMEQMTDSVELNMMKAIKKALDPNLIMNPGKIFNVE